MKWEEFVMQVEVLTLRYCPCRFLLTWSSCKRLSGYFSFYVYMAVQFLYEVYKNPCGLKIIWTKLDAWGEESDVDHHLMRCEKPKSKVTSQWQEPLFTIFIYWRLHLKVDLGISESSGQQQTNSMTPWSWKPFCYIMLASPLKLKKANSFNSWHLV